MFYMLNGLCSNKCICLLFAKTSFTDKEKLMLLIFEVDYIPERSYEWKPKLVGTEKSIAVYKELPMPITHIEQHYEMLYLPFFTV